MRRGGFTLVELLTVMAILAILYAIAVPAIIATKAAVQSTVAMNGLRDLGQAINMYTADSDDYAPLACYTSETGSLQAWFGRQTSPGHFDTGKSLLAPYEKGKPPHDPIFSAAAWLGDGSGYGYNWGYIGSDFNMKGSYAGFPNCQNPAAMSQLADPSQTVTFATSSYFFAPWLPGGDGRYYEFNFIDPPRLWNGNPNVDFRHQGTKTVDTQGRQVTSTGHALVVRADGSAKSRHMGDLDDKQFER